MDRQMPFDELNILRQETADIMALPVEERQQYRDFLYDELLDILILSYVFGNEAANDMLGTSIDIEQSELLASVGKEVAGETWVQRFEYYFADESATAEDIMRVAETDSHRIYNEAVYAVGNEAERQGEVILKEWECMMLPTSRDTHIYLNGMRVPLDEPFYTYDGDFAMHPGDFNLPENNVNCLCRLRLVKVG